jgi:hypothetical protein
MPTKRGNIELLAVVASSLVGASNGMKLAVATVNKTGCHGSAIKLPSGISPVPKTRLRPRTSVTGAGADPVGLL